MDQKHRVDLPGKLQVQSNLCKITSWAHDITAPAKTGND